ncbi:protein GUCD1 [Lycorma delicatula]|uniref:protein GUCD1 n=1 Tax=Lycorma delicatula TaxID=130591 RepID=UPI003F514936
MEGNDILDCDLAPVKMRKMRYVKQRYSWDCGVTCIMMILPLNHYSNFLKNFHQICKEESFNKSTWTIDLCYLLRRYDVKHVYCTLTIGINPHYKDQAFYTKILNKDEERVTRRFSEAENCGITVIKKSLQISDLINHLHSYGPIILLTNANLLRCDTCRVNRFTSGLQTCLHLPLPYHGHYILVFGYNLPNEKVYYRNPSYRDRVCTMSFNSLVSAWKSVGTDQDTILIYYYS